MSYLLLWSGKGRISLMQDSLYIPKSVQQIKSLFLISCKDYLYIWFKLA